MGKHFAVLAVLLLLVGLAAPARASSESVYKTYATGLVAKLPGNISVRADLETYLSALASRARKKEGLKGLTASSRLRIAARAQAADMALGDYLSHYSRNGDSFSVRFAAFAPDWNGRRGENAAREPRGGGVDKAKARRLFGQWLDSSGHRRNMMRTDYDFVSTGAVQIGNTLYAVQIFWQKQDVRNRTKPGSAACLFTNCTTDGPSRILKFSPGVTGPR